MLTVNIPTSYHYTQCGLSYIYLLDGYRFSEEGKQKTIYLRKRDKIYEELADYILSKPDKLCGEELAFLLKRTNTPDDDFCETFKIKPNELRKWTNRRHEALMPLATEVSVRMLLGEMLGCWRLVSDILEGLHATMKKPYLKPEIVFLRATEKGWEVAKGI